MKKVHFPHLSLFSLLFLPLCVVSCADGKVDIDSLRADVEYLASDACDGRLPFSEGADRATTYIARRMESIGLQPGGDGGFLQQVPVAMIRTKVPEQVTVTTPQGDVALRRNVDYTAFSQVLEPEIEVQDAELVFAGYGIVAPEYGKDDYAGITHPEGTIAVVMVNDPGLGTDGDYFHGDAMTYYGRWTYKYEEGARQGLRGVLIIHDDRGAGYGWSVASGREVRYALSDDAGAPACPFTGWLSAEAAVRLLAACGYDAATLYEEAKRPDFRPFSLQSRMSLTMTNEMTFDSSPNVVGYLPGRSDECIVCTAHWDHLGHAAEPKDGDDIINGATDNATGVAWLLETARLLRHQSLRRSIVFISTTCEEPGLFGSEYYTRHPLKPIDNTVAVINMDVIPLWGENNEVTVTGYGNSTLDEMLEEEARAQGRYVMADPDASNGMFYRSDQLPFMRRGVPALFAKGWSDNRRHGREWSTQMIRDYWANTYHKPCDQSHPDDDYSGLAQDVRLFRNLLLRLATTDERPQWYEGSEFRRKQ